MSLRYKGGLISPSVNPLAANVTTSPNVAQYNGVFTPQQQGQALTSQQWVGDPTFENTTLLLHADGKSNGSQNNTFLDSSSNNLSVTRNGSLTQGSFTPYGPTWSNYFDGATSTQLTLASNAAFAFGTGAYTMEGWVYLTSAATYISTMFEAGSATNAISLGVAANGAVQIGKYGIGTVLSSTAGDVPLNQWVHIAACRASTSSNDTKLYVNGVLKATGTDNNNWTVTNTPAVGGINLSGYTTTGYISNLRVVKGTAVYTGAFTPSTTPLTAITNTSLLTCQSNRFIDNSSNAFALTAGGSPSVQRFSPFAPQYQYTPAVIGGSGYFDGSGDYLSNNGASGAFAFGTGAFTIEFWMYASSATARQGLYTNNTASVGTGPVFAITGGGTTGVIGLGNVGSADSVQTGSNAFSANAWHHVALVREGTGANQTKIYVDGVQKAAGTYADNLSASREMLIGATYGYGEYFNGYLSNIRVVKGTAVYTTAFTPPTAPLTAISNTSLLLSCTNAGIYDNAMMNDLETGGNALISTAVAKYGSGSIWFNGSSVNNYIANEKWSPNFNFGAGDFTVEAWVNPSRSAGSDAVICGVWDGLTNPPQSWLMFLNTSGNLSFVVQFATNNTILTSSTTVSNSVWTHVAVSRNGSNWYAFINGIVVATASNSTAISAGSNRFVVGQYVNIQSAQYWNGYIDDLRITKGVARYTSNFVPPQVAFANQ